MLIACWSSKGGSGTTVVACGLAVLSGRAGATLLADLAGDVPAVLGTAEPEGPGSGDWLAAEAGVPVDRLASIEVDVVDGLRLLPASGGRTGEHRSALRAGEEPFASAMRAVDGRAEELAQALVSDPRTVVADCGTLSGPAAVAVAAAAPVGLLVLRPCYVALRRALLLPVRPTGVVLVRERDRVLGRLDVEEVLGVPVRAQVEFDPAVARAVDAGLLASRLPRTLERSLRGAA